MRVRKVLGYNVFHFPADVVTVVGAHNFFALFLALVYYGGGAIIIYDILKIGLPVSLAIWMLAGLVNMGLYLNFPGLFYLDDVSSTEHRLSILILGPINFLRAFCLGVTFMWAAKSIYPFTFRQLFAMPPEMWSVDNKWIKAIQRSRDIGMRSLVGDIRAVFCAIGRWLWKVGNKERKLDGMMLLSMLSIVTVIIAFLLTMFAVWLRLLG